MLSKLDLNKQYRCSMFSQRWILWFPPNVPILTELFFSGKCWFLTFANFRNLWFWEYHIYRCCQQSRLMESLRMFLIFHFWWLVKFSLRIVDFLMLPKRDFDEAHWFPIFPKCCFWWSVEIMIFRCRTHLICMNIIGVLCLPEVSFWVFPQTDVLILPTIVC